MENFGSYLRTHREKKSIRLEEIASITKIHLHSLELLEASQWEQLPPEPFIRGFIIAYAKYIGLEPKEVLERYFEETGRRKAPVSPTQTQDVGSAPQTTSETNDNPSDLISAATGFQASTKIVAGVAAAVVIAIVAILISVGKSADQPGTDGVQVSSTTPNATEAAATATGEAKPAGDRSVAVATAPKDTPKPMDAFAHEVVVEGKERTWVKVVIDENPPLEFFLSQGEKATYTAKQKIKVVLGNSTGAKVMHNGQTTEGAKFMGTIRSFKFPANAKFPQDNVAKRDTTSAENNVSAPTSDAGAPAGDVPSVE